MITNKQLIGIKIEATQNTAVTLSTGDFAHAYDVKINPKVELNPQKFVSPTLSRFSDRPGKSFYEVEFTLPLKGSGTPGTASAPLGAALQASGLVETAGASTVVYSLTSAEVSGFWGPGKSCTVKAYQDGILHIAAGCKFNASWDIEAGKSVGIKFKGMGIWAAPTDAAFPSNTPVGINAQIVSSAALTIQSVSMIASKLSIDLGYKVTMRDNVSAASGVGGFALTDRDVKGSVDPERVTVAVHDFFNIMKLGTEASLSVVVGTATEVCTITAPKVQYGQIEPGDRGGIAIFNVPLLFNRNAGDDELVITFAAPA